MYRPSEFIFFKLLIEAKLSNILMCVRLYLLIRTALRAHAILVEELYEINDYCNDE